MGLSLSLLHYPLITLIFWGVLRLYLKIAIRFRIFDRPNNRSSHNYITIRGGGLLFLVAAIIHSVEHIDIPGKLEFLTGLIIVGVVSFLDDIKPIPARYRLVVQIFAVTFAFWGVSLFGILPWYAIIGAYILFVGVINAVNFMDGINGMTGLTALVVLFALQYINRFQVEFAHVDFMRYGMLACVVFLWFNYRRKALCFAGDVGSVSIAFWIIFLMLKLMIETGSGVWILLLAVYGVDTVCTLLHRLATGQSIFRAHQTFFFHILCLEQGLPQRVVSMLYALAQLAVSAVVIFYWQSLTFAQLALVTLLPLTAIYLTKFLILHRKKGRASRSVQQPA